MPGGRIWQVGLAATGPPLRWTICARSGEVQRLAHADVVERRGADVEEHDARRHLWVHASLRAMPHQEVRGVPARELADIGHEVSRTGGDSARAAGSPEVESQQHPVGISVGLGGS
jgi:hypothetical protein